MVHGHDWMAQLTRSAYAQGSVTATLFNKYKFNIFKKALKWTPWRKSRTPLDFPYTYFVIGLFEFWSRAQSFWYGEPPKVAATPFIFCSETEHWAWKASGAGALSVSQQCVCSASQGTRKLSRTRARRGLHTYFPCHPHSDLFNLSNDCLEVGCHHRSNCRLQCFVSRISLSASPLLAWRLLLSSLRLPSVSA